MKPHTAFVWFCSLMCLSLLMVLPTTAQQTLYDNGPINGEVDSFTINFGFVVSDNFTISAGQSSVDGLTFGAWTFPGDVVESVEVTISTQSLGGGIRFFDDTVNLTQSGCFTNNFGFDVCTETGSFSNVPLNSGTYWLTLQNAVVNTGDPTYWDENDGVGCSSPGCPSQGIESSVGSIPSEAFTVLGSTSTTTTTGTTPEPAGLILFGTGVLSVIGLLKRKLP